VEILLPLSGTRLDVRPPNGADDLLLLEAPRADRALAVEFLSRIAGGADLGRLAVHDFEALALELRSLLVGESVVAEARCACGAPVDVRFTVRDYLRHKRPRRVRRIRPAPETGWLEIEGAAVQFRLPTVGDQLDVAGHAQPWEALAERCVRPASMARRVDGLMRALAPPLSDVVEGTCPHCLASVRFAFDVPVFLLAELRAGSALLDEEVHLLASAYRWSEEKILALPRSRRRRYADLIRTERRAP
jgi:hypothetical protein